MSRLSHKSYHVQADGGKIALRFPLIFFPFSLDGNILEIVSEVPQNVLNIFFF